MGKYIGQHIKVVLLDHDDTLVATREAKWAQHKLIAKHYYDKDLTDEEILQHWGKPLHELLCVLYDTDNVERAMSYTKTHHKDYPKIIFAETISTLRRIKKLGYLIGIIIATTRFSFEYDLKINKIPKTLIDYIQTAEETSYHKPDPKVFEPALKWLKKNKIKPNEVIYVGDGLQDLAAALGAGFNFIGVETGLVTAAQFKKAGAVSLPGIAHLVK